MTKEAEWSHSITEPFSCLPVDLTYHVKKHVDLMVKHAVCRKLHLPRLLSLKIQIAENKFSMFKCHTVKCLHAGRRESSLDELETLLNETSKGATWQLLIIRHPLMMSTLTWKTNTVVVNGAEGLYTLPMWFL